MNLKLKDGSTELNSGVMFPRFKISLDDFWDFKIDPDVVGEALSWYRRDRFVDADKIKVPYCFQSQFPQLLDYHGFAWYQNIFSVPEANSGCRVVLHIGAVNYDPKIWVNEKLVGEFQGGNYPLEVDLTGFIKFGDINVLTLRINHPDFPMIYDYPHGKQTVYGYVGGIWQSTYIEFTSMIYLSNIFVTSDINDSKVKLNLEINNLPEDPRNFTIDLQLTSPQGDVTEETFNVDNNHPEMEITLSQMALWSPDNPCLYKVEIILKQAKKEIDQETLNVGFREIEARDGKIYLNGKPIYLVGALNQDFYPKTIYTPPSDDLIKKEIELAKRMGINFLRMHIKFPDQKYLNWADKLGILIWEEPPCIGSFNPRAEQRLTKTFREMVLRDRNHPSVIIWGIINEAWGVDPATSDGREWLIKMYGLVKKLDPTRLVVDNSPCRPNFHIITDVNDFHQYNTIPGSYKQWVDFVKRFAKDPSWTFGNNPIRKGNEPLMVSEFGSWGLPGLKKILEPSFNKPWWFSQGWDAGIPAGVEVRFNSWGLSEIWGSWEEFAISSQWHQFESLKFMIEEMRKYPQICGYIITQFYDLHWESNGLLDFNRNPKSYVDDLLPINNKILLIIDRVNTKTNLWSGDVFKTTLYLSNWSGEELKDAKLRWRLGDILKGELSGLNFAFYDTLEIGTLSFVAPEIQNLKKFKLIVELFDSRDNVLASNNIDIIVSSKDLKSPLVKNEKLILVYLPNQTLISLAKKLKSLGYNVELSDSGTIKKEVSCIVTSSFNNEVKNYFEKGGNVLLIPTSPQILKLKDESYSIGMRGGEAFTGYYYIKKKEFFEGLPLENPMGWTYYITLPRLVIKDIPISEKEKICAGHFEGWAHQNSATLLQEENGHGGLLIISTFNFEEYGDDPITTQLFNNILQKLIN